jgi:hypothetical protein
MARARNLFVGRIEEAHHFFSFWLRSATSRCIVSSCCKTQIGMERELDEGPFFSPHGRQLYVMTLHRCTAICYNARLEVFMRYRVPALAVLLALSLTIACSKPATQSSQTQGEEGSQAQQAQPSQAPEQQPSAAAPATPAKEAPVPQKRPRAAETAGTAPQPGAERTKAAEPLTIPRNTALTVRMGQTVSSKTSQPGETFVGTIAQPVEVNGTTVIPAGAEATGTVTDAVPLGRFKGAAKLALRLETVTIGGRKYDVQTTAVSRTEKGKGKRTGILTGGGAGLGALIGGLAGGGKGAVIGAIAGAGAGGAGSAFTGNKDIVIPAESAVTFKLLEPVTLK